MILIIRVKVKAESPFFAWLFQFGDKAQIEEPAELREKYIKQLKVVLSSTE